MDGWTRRETLAGAVGLVAAAPCAAVTAPTTGLNAIAATRGLRFGSAIAWGAPGADRASIANPLYTRLVTAECGVIVPENEMKWQAISPTPTTLDFARCDAIVGWANRHRIAVRGHNLLWHQNKWLPRWMASYDFGAHPAREGERLLDAHIRAVIGRYGAHVHSWDVVNEAVNPADGSLYDTTLSRAIGGAEATVDLAFRQARAAAPHAQLVYNDYMSWEANDGTHRAGVLRLLERLRRRGTPVDALGLQSHIITQGLGDGPGIGRQQAEWRRFLDEVAAMGFSLLVTEFDVRDEGLPADIAVRDRAVADYARAYLDVTLDQRGVRDVLCWGLVDRYTWLDHAEPRRDGLRRRATLYDDRFRAKPLRAAVAAALSAAPTR